MNKNYGLALVALLGAGSAQAVTFTTSAFNAPYAPGETSLVTFDTGEDLAATGFVLSGDGGLATGRSAAASAPRGDTTQFFYVSSALGSGTATLASTASYSTLSFYWGSMDVFNTLDVLGAGGDVIFTLSGSDVATGPARGNLRTAANNRRVYLTAGAGEQLTGLAFRSTGVAFEIDDLAGTVAVIPEPESWALMIAGFALVGAAGRRRRTIRSVVA